MKASQLDATQKIHYLYNSYYYDFIPDDSIPTGYQFNSDVIEYVISKGADAINTYQTQRFGKIINAGVNFVASVVYSLMRNSAVFLGKINSQFIDSNASIYTWHYECTGIDTDYEFSSEYGTAYGFKFVGICDEVFTLVLDQNGGFYGSERIGNWTYSTGTTEVINQIAPQYDPNEILVPTGYMGSFQDLKPPYIDGKSLHAFFYINNVEHEIYIDDFRNVVLRVDYYNNDWSHAIRYLEAMDISKTHSFNMYVDGTLVTDTGYFAGSYSYNGLHTNVSAGSVNTSNVHRYDFGSNVWPSMNLPVFYLELSRSSNQWNSPNFLGSLNNQLASGSGDIWLGSIPTTPTSTPANPNPAPINVPIPVTEIPSNPEDPIPQNPTPDPVPGVPVTPVPIPLPPFASIVSGNDELWGETLGFEEAQDGLLPYMTSLSEFSFPSFTDLISDFSGSIIWVAQIMSVLYNGTSFNVLFIALCLFSLVSILIGAYKLWATTEPDPNNPGFRRSKRPPKPPKGRRRR